MIYQRVLKTYLLILVNLNRKILDHRHCIVIRKIHKGLALNIICSRGSVARPRSCPSAKWGNQGGSRSPLGRALGCTVEPSSTGDGGFGVTFRRESPTKFAGGIGSGTEVSSPSSDIHRSVGHGVEVLKRNTLLGGGRQPSYCCTYYISRIRYIIHRLRF
jgi:hypothetical protein